MNFIPDTILRAVCWTLLHSLWQGLILAIVAGVIMVLSKKAGSALRYNLLCTLLVLFTVVSGYTFYRQLSSPVTDPAVNRSTDPTTGIAKTGSDKQLTEGATTGHFLQNAVDSLVQYFNAHASLVVVVWFIVFLARFVKVLSGLVYVQRIRHYKTSPVSPEWQDKLTQLLDRLQIRQAVLLVESAIVKMPVVIGAFRPVILVPIGLLTQLSPGQVESILIHELAHIRRRDYLFNLVQHLVDTLFFFNPALRWVSSLIRSERENCCDDIAIRETRSRRQFVEALVSFHEYSRVARGYALSFAEKENNVVRRVKRIVYKKNHSLNAGERVLLMGGLMMLSAAFITIGGSRANVLQDRPGKLHLSQQASSRSAVHTPVSTTAGMATTTGTTGTTATNAATAKLAALPVTVALHSGTPSIGAPSVETSSTGATSIEVPSNDKSSTAASPIRLSFLGTIQANIHVSLNNSSDTTIKGAKKDLDPEDGPAAEEAGKHRLDGEERSLAKLREGLQSMGYLHISDDKLIECQQHGVRAWFISEFKQLGYTDISLDMAIELKDHGVDADFINSLVRAGYIHISLDRARELRDHGVTASFIMRFKEQGYNQISLDKAQELRDHGVTPGFIADIRAAGFQNLPLDKAQQLRDHGVTVGFIMAFKKKMGTQLELDDYIRLRDSGISPS